MFLLTLFPTEKTYDTTRPAGSIEDSLITRISKGEKEAMIELYNGTKTAVYSFALSILSNKHDAEDIMHDAYIKVYCSAGGYEPQGKPMAWILTIVRNLSLMRLREARNKDVPIDEQFLQSGDNSFDNNSLNGMALDAAMSQLSAQERQIIALHSASGLKHREIADILQIPLSTALSKYRRALSKLKNILKEDE